MLTQLRAKNAAPSFCTRGSVTRSTGPKAAKSTSGQGGRSAPNGGRGALMVESACAPSLHRPPARSQDLRQNGSDGVGLADLGDDAELAARGRLDLLHRLVALEGVQRLAFDHRAAIGHQPFRQDALVHREADLRYQYLRTHCCPLIACIQII